MALIFLCEEDVDPTGSDVRSVRSDRIRDIILQLYLSVQCQITPLTKNETGPHMEQLSPNQEFSIWCVGQLEKKHCFCRVFAHFFAQFNYSWVGQSTTYIALQNVVNGITVIFLSWRIYLLRMLGFEGNATFDLVDKVRQRKGSWPIWITLEEEGIQNHHLFIQPLLSKSI